MTVDEVAKLLRLSRGSTYAAVRAGIIPAVRVGRRFLIPAKAIEKMLLDAVEKPHRDASQHHPF